MRVLEDLFGAVLFVSAVLVGTFTGSLRDPLFVFMLAASIGAGAARLPWWALATIAITFAAIRAGIAYPRYLQLTDNPWFPVGRSFVMNAVIMATAAAFGRLIRRVARR